jgi:A/G-specific adenine glycosylase
LKTASKIPKLLLKWYKKEGRVLPWRTTFAPYPVWVSEIMLQQTQVDTVIPYYHRFLEMFPTIHSLAKASSDQVLKQWEGLGYYSRARNLHRSAQVVVERFNGILPDQFEELMMLPGIGRSTAGAILSLAYNLPFPILDGNVRRVLSRLFAIQIEQGKELDRTLWTRSESLVPEKEARSFNSAFMDLGATLCKPQEPLCKICPLKNSCIGFEKNLQKILPLKKKRAKIQVRFNAALVIWKNNQVFIRKRDEKGLLGGLWEFPGEWINESPLQNQESPPDWNLKLGLKWTAEEFFLRLNHTFTHFKMELYAYQAEYRSGKGGLAETHRWVTLEEIEELPFSATDKKIIRALRQ